MSNEFEYRVKETYGPGRVNTRLIADWKGDHGVLCLGCNTVVSGLFTPCQCNKKEDNK